MTAAVGGTLTVREAAPADRTAMLDLWVEAWSRVRPEIDFAARHAWLDSHLDAVAVNGATVLLAEDGSGAVLGFVSVDPVARELDQLVTGVEAQGSGVGQRLLRHAKELSPAGLSLTVNQFNARAIRLYEREGFVVVGDGVNAVSGLPVWHMRWPGAAPQRVVLADSRQTV